MKNSPIQKNKSPSYTIRWTAWIALFIVALLYETLPRAFYWGPDRLLIGLVALISVPIIIFHWRKNAFYIRIFTLSANGLITFYIIISISRIAFAAFEGHIGPKHLITSAIILWIANILVFALWYWNLDAGGPHKRESKDFQGISSFLFPQKQIILMENPKLPDEIKNWTPTFIDYLFLAFNTSTAFSPTDTPILNRWAKCMGMVQSLISLTIVLVLAARAINIINPNTNYLVS